MIDCIEPGVILLHGCHLEMISAADRSPLSALNGSAWCGGTDAGCGGTRRQLPVDPNRNVALQDPHCVETWMCGAISSQGLSYVVRGCSPPQGFFLGNDSFQPRNVLQQALAGQDEKVITELRILKVDFEALFIGYRKRE